MMVASYGWCEEADCIARPHRLVVQSHEWSVEGPEELPHACQGFYRGSSVCSLPPEHPVHGRYRPLPRPYRESDRHAYLPGARS